MRPNVRPNGWQKLSTVARPPKPMTVMAPRSRREVAPTTFRKIGVPTLQHLAVLRDDKWYAAVISIWSFMGEELGRERTQTRKSYATSAEANRAAERMRTMMERAHAEPDDRITTRTAERIRRAAGRASSVAASNRLFATPSSSAYSLGRWGILR